MSKEWTKPMQWDNEGTPPSETLAKNGFQAYYKPPANIFNYFLHRVKACIEELQAEADNIISTKASKEELNNTDRSKAPTNHASVATIYGAATDALYGHAKASGTVPKAHGKASAGTETAAFARGDHVHPMQESGLGVTTAGTATAYTATVAGISELRAGVNFMMIPHVSSTASNPTLNVNGLGAKSIRRRLSGSGTATVGDAHKWIWANKPFRVTYDGTYWIADTTQPDASDLYGVLQAQNGGTGLNRITPGVFLVGNEMGGFDAKETAEVRQLLGYGELLWENESPTTAFVAQTIEVDLSGYTLVTVYFYEYIQPSNMPEPNACVVAVGTKTDLQGHIQPSNGALLITSRTITISAEEVKFESCYQTRVSGTSASSSLSNAELIPFKICGYR